jgi:hypothetical protein
MADLERIRVRVAKAMQRFLEWNVNRICSLVDTDQFLGMSVVSLSQSSNGEAHGVVRGRIWWGGGEGGNRCSCEVPQSAWYVGVFFGEYRSLLSKEIGGLKG